MSEHQLRDLARQIETLAKEHPAYSQAQPAVSNLVNHLSAIARCHECNAELINKQNDMYKAVQPIHGAWDDGTIRER